MNTEYITMRAAQLDRHKRVFTRWINMQLAKANPPADVKDLFNDLKDGQVLLTLVEILLGIEVSRQKESRHRINQLSNVQQAMGHFGRNKVNTLGIIASEIVAGGQRATLSLVWSIIVRFQINEAIQPEPRDYGFDKKLMEWCQQRLQEYKGKVRIANFTTSWSDGLGFNALLHSFSPSVFDFDQISACDTATRLNHAFNVAATVYGVPKVVEPEDIVQDKPDKNLITLFLSYIYLLERREIVTVVTKEGEPEVTTKTYHFTTRYETTTSQKNGVTRETTIQYSGSTTEADANDGLFYDVREEGGGNEKMLRMQGLPTGIHVQQERQEEAVEPSSTPQRSAVKTYKTYKVTTISTTTKTDNGNTPGPTDVKEKQIIDDVTKPTVKENVQEVTPVKVWLPREYAVEKKITVINKQDQQSSSDQHKNVLATTLDLQAEDSEEEKPANITTLSQTSSSDLDDSHSDGKGNDYARCDPDDSSSNLLDYLTKRLDHADQRLFDLERSLINSDKDSMDLKSTKKALDQNKELAVEPTSAESEIHDVLKEGSGFINKKCFDKPHEEYFTKRLNNTDNRVKALVDTTEKERQRLFDLYIILLKQHLERMNDWLVRAESRMALDDEIEPSYQEVQKQVMDHQKFQEDLANYSMANMILDLDLDDPAIDETARDWVKVLSERWAAVWNWAEEWKEKLNQALIDWEKFREEEQTLLTWLSSKEQALDTIKQTDITDENQVKADLSLLEGLEGEMDTQRNRLVSLHETGEQLIRDANYLNSVAKNIRDQTEDFDRCWEDISDTLKRRKNMLEDGNAKLKQIGSLMEELRSWMSDAEIFIKSLAEEKEPATENIIEETIELKCKERDSNQLKIDEITKLEMELSGNIDKTSNRDMKNVTKPLIKRWNDISNKLNKYRNADLPYTKANDWSFMKFLKKTFATN